MNVFFLSDNPEEAAKWHVDRHCVKMILEAAQLLATTAKQYAFEAHYKATHVNHPVRIWTGLSRANYLWVCHYGLALCDEYTARYGKEHKSRQYIVRSLDIADQINFPQNDLTPFPKCMPDEFKVECPIESYRNYYRLGKVHLHKWKRNKPTWIL